MQISLTKPELEHFVQEQIKDGRFASPADLVEAAIAQLMLDATEDVAFGEPRVASLKRSQDQIARGQVRPFADAAGELRRKHLGG